VIWNSSREVDVNDVVYEPLPAMDGDELGRLRTIIGLPDDGSGEIPARRPSPVIDLGDHREPRNYLEERLDEVDRKLEKLLDAGPMPVFNAFFGEALVSVHSEIDELRIQLQQLQSSIDLLRQTLFG
jgi:hypothetical protein